MKVTSYLPVQQLYKAAKDLLTEVEHEGLKAAVENIERCAAEAERNKGAVAEAREIYAEGCHKYDIEVDDSPFVSEVEDGVWVQGWLWVAKEESETEETE